MYIIAGLGNPGKEYEKTRHNVGFMALDILADNLNIKLNKVKFKGLIGEGKFNNEKLLLLKPYTYMNLSGESVADAVNFYKIPLNNLIIIYDDMDLPVGKLRIKPEGSSGGHKGMDSIIYNLSSDKFNRIRIGIGKPEGETDVVGHVLGKFYGPEIEKIKKVTQAAADAALKIISDGTYEAMNQFNGYCI